MAKWGKFEFGEFEKLAKSFKKAVDERVIERFIQDFLLEMAMRSLRRIKKRTPIDSGELRRNWKVGRVVKQGSSYVVEIFNNTDYALTKGACKTGQKRWTLSMIYANTVVTENTTRHRRA